MSFHWLNYSWTRRFELVTPGFELVTRRFKLATRKVELVTRGFELATHGFELVTRNSQLVFYHITPFTCCFFSRYLLLNMNVNICYSQVLNKKIIMKCLAIKMFAWFFKRQSCHQIETSQLIGRANQLSGFYMKASLEYICPILHFYTPWKCQKIKDFLTFSRCIEIGDWARMS